MPLTGAHNRFDCGCGIAHCNTDNLGLALPSSSRKQTHSTPIVRRVSAGLVQQIFSLPPAAISAGRLPQLHCAYANGLEMLCILFNPSGEAAGCGKLRFVLRRPIVPVVILVIVFAGNTLGTTIVGIATNDSVIVGADSKTSRDGTREIGRMCKIVLVDGYAAAMAGHLGDAATGFDAAALIRRALSNSGHLALKVQSFEQLIRPALQKSLDYGRKNAPLLFASTYVGKKALQTIFVTAEGGKPIMMVSIFRVTEEGELTLDERKELGPGQVYVFGENGAISKYQTATKNWNAAEPIEIVRKFLEIESNEKPDLVGPPFSILQMTSTGQHWSAPGLCTK